MSNPTVWVLQHIHCETLGTIGNVLESAGIAWQYIRTFEGQPLPESTDDAAGLIVLGGPMGVYEQSRYPFLMDEMRLIEWVLGEEKPVLGVCLGSQLLAATLGSRVMKGKKKEIGWYPVSLSEAAKDDPLWAENEMSFMAYHWHGDIFDLPKGATALASSEMTEFQAFRFDNRAYGFLFHLEVTKSGIDDMVRTFEDELREAGVDGRGILDEARDYLPELEKTGTTIFKRWTGLVPAGGVKNLR